MSAALRDIGFLWSTRKSSGFPWPFQGLRFWPWRVKLHVVAFGRPPWTTISIWKQALAIPLRPLRYVRMVRRVAYTRSIHKFYPADYDNVP